MKKEGRPVRSIPNLCSTRNWLIGCQAAGQEVPQDRLGDRARGLPIGRGGDAEPRVVRRRQAGLLVGQAPGMAALGVGAAKNARRQGSGGAGQAEADELPLEAVDARAISAK